MPAPPLRWALAALLPLLAGAGVTLAGPGDAEPRKTAGAERPGPVNLIVIHAVGGPICVAGQVAFDPIPFADTDAADWKAYLEKQPVTGIHYVVGRSGAVAASIPEDQIANHASRANPRSIGIELVNRGDGIEPFPEEQVAALIDLVKQIRARHSVPLAGIVTHADVDQRTCMCGEVSYRRRVDPGPKFPLERVRSEAALPDEEMGVAAYTPMTGAVDGDLCANRP